MDAASTMILLQNNVHPVSLQTNSNLANVLYNGGHIVTSFQFMMAQTTLL